MKPKISAAGRAAIKRAGNLLDMQVPAPDSLTPRQWWPDLFVLMPGRVLQKITPELAGRLADVQWPADPREFREPILCDIEGRKIGRVSYNGRVWLHDIDGDKEIPREGHRTASEAAAVNWAAPALALNQISKP